MHCATITVKMREVFWPYVSLVHVLLFTAKLRPALDFQIFFRNFPVLQDHDTTFFQSDFNSSTERKIKMIMQEDYVILLVLSTGL